MKPGLTVVFCLPGAHFSAKFLRCWTELLHWCFANGVRPLVSQAQSCNIYYVRNMCLGGDVQRGPKQKPFDGKAGYDLLMWIDSDMVFTPAGFQRLLAHDKDIVSGVYLMEDGKHLATCREWDEAHFRKHGYFAFLTPQEVDQGDGLLDVAYTGMGFILVKRGVFESLDYPWFRPLPKKIGRAVDFTMEDVAFCLRAREAGFRVLVDPKVRVGHEKAVVL